MGKLLQVLVIGALIRFAIPTILTNVVPTLSETNLLSSPINSYKSLKEAFYYLKYDMNLYDGGVNHHPPLLVIILLFINYPIAFDLLYTIIDVVITLRLVRLNRWYNDHNSKRVGLKFTGFNDDLIASFYLFNPLLILSNMSKSTLIFTNFFIIESLHQLLLKRNFKRSMVTLAVATYLSLTPIFMVFSILCLGQAALQLSKSQIFKAVIVYISVVVFLLISSYAALGSTDFINQTYGTIVLHNKMSPNMGLWWYLFAEMFEFFTPFYTGLFNLYSFIFIIPIGLRFLEVDKIAGDSFLGVVITYIWLSFTKSYPTFGDLAFGISLLPIFKDTVIPQFKYSVFIGLGMLVSVLLAPIFYYCWIVLGNGNSNFFYSINLVWGVVHIIILLDLIWGKLTYDYLLQHKVGSVRLTQ